MCTDIHIHTYIVVHIYINIVIISVTLLAKTGRDLQGPKFTVVQSSDTT